MENLNESKSKKSIGLFIKLPKEIAAKFPDDRLKKDDSPAHITFLVIGNDFTKEEEYKIFGILHKMIASMPPIEAELDEVDYFENDKYIIPHVKIKFNPPLAPWRRKIWKELEKFGIKVEDRFKTYKPHSTLAYVEVDDIEDIENYKWNKKTPKGKFTIEKMELWGLKNTFSFDVDEKE